MAHNDTVFAQVLKLVPRHEFESLARKHKSGRMSRSMTRWGQFVAMGMAQLTGRCSLRDIVSNLAAQSCKLYHLGVGVVTRSSLARVNAEKPWEMYEELHGRLLGRCQAKAPGHGYRFKAKLFSVDSTTIDLCLSAFPWAKFRRTKGAVKVHVGLDHEGYLPTFVRVTNGKTSDIEAARALTLPKGSIVAADRAYVDFAWIDWLISEGIHLVTRLKRGIQYGVVETREVNAKRGVTSDETIEFTSAKGRKQCPHRLRRIGYHDRKTGKDYVFLTTHFHLSAKTIADIYKSRWQVELFFKWIKQNLKVKSFVGTSRNAVMTQVWTAMCIYLILSYLKFANRASSAESVGEFWFGQVAKCVIQSDFQCPGGAEPRRPFGDHSGLSVEAFDNATGELPPGSEPVQNQVAVRAQPCGQPPSSGRAASASSGCTSGRGTGRPSTATRSPTAIESPP